MALRSTMTRGVQMPGFRYVVFGAERGYVSTQRTKRAAARPLAEGARARMGGGTPCDALAYH